MEASQQNVEENKGSRWSRLPTWAKWTLGVVGALILLGIGAAIGSSEEDDLKAELAEAEAALVKAESERDAAEANASNVFSRKEEILDRAKANAARITGEARSEGARLSNELQDLRGEVDTAEGELAETESSLAGAEREEALSSFGDGIWQAEVDFIPGTYRAPGGGGCYWALLNSADTSDIVNNGGFDPNQTITIDSPWFETSGCGQWERVE